VATSVALTELQVFRHSDTWGGVMKDKAKRDRKTIDALFTQNQDLMEQVHKKDMMCRKLIMLALKSAENQDEIGADVFEIIQGDHFLRKCL